MAHPILLTNDQVDQVAGARPGCIFPPPYARDFQDRLALISPQPLGAGPVKAG